MLVKGFVRSCKKLGLVCKRFWIVMSVGLLVWVNNIECKLQRVAIRLLNLFEIY